MKIKAIKAKKQEKKASEREVFNAEKYTGNFAMHCKTKAEAINFCKYLHSIGRKWADGSSYLSKNAYWHIAGGNYYLAFNDGELGSDALKERFCILEWSDFAPFRETKDFWDISERCPSCGHKQLFLKSAYEMGVLTDYFVACNNCNWVQPNAGHYTDKYDAVEAFRASIAKETEPADDKTPTRLSELDTPFREMTWISGNLTFGQKINANDIVVFKRQEKITGVYYMLDVVKGMAINLVEACCVKIDKGGVMFEMPAKNTAPVDIKKIFIDCVDPTRINSVTKIEIYANKHRMPHFWNDISRALCNCNTEKKKVTHPKAFYYEVILKNGANECHYFITSPVSLEKETKDTVMQICNLTVAPTVLSQTNAVFKNWMFNKESIKQIKEISYEDYMLRSNNGFTHGFTVTTF